MIGALNTAIAGLQNAAARVDQAARTIVRAGFEAGNSVNADPDAPPPAAGASLDRAPVEPDLLTGIVDLKQAELAYRANAKVVASVGDLEKSLLDILS